MKIMIAKGVKIDKKIDNNMTPLLLASAAGHRSIVKLLLQNKANIKSMDNDKRTSLHYASYCGHEAVVKELIKYVKSVNDPDSFSYSPVHYAINERRDSVYQGKPVKCRVKLPIMFGLYPPGSR